MKITESKLRELIREELESMNEENFNVTKFTTMTGDAFEHIQQGLEILQNDIPTYLKKTQQSGMISREYEKLVSDLDKTLTKLDRVLSK